MLSSAVVKILKVHALYDLHFATQHAMFRSERKCPFKYPWKEQKYGEISSVV